jgi:hypothetical protein
MDSVPHFLPVVILCTVHLVIGLGIGFLLWASGWDRSSQLDQLEDLGQFYRKAFERLAAHANRVHSIVEIEGALVPEPLAIAVRNLSKATRDFQAQAKGSKGSAPRPAAARPEETHAISTAEIRSVLASSPSELGYASEEVEAERHAYNASQWMGRFAGHRLPMPEEFEQVLCHDLSSTGVSFYADDVQIGQKVVIEIGPRDSRMFVVAEVMNRRVVTHKDELTYLIGCRFRRRLNPEADGEIVAEYSHLPAQAPLGRAC